MPKCSMVSASAVSTLSLLMTLHSTGRTLLGKSWLNLVGFGAGRLWRNVPDRHFSASSGEAAGDLAANGTAGAGRHGLFAVEVKSSQCVYLAFCLAA